MSRIRSLTAGAVAAGVVLGGSVVSAPAASADVVLEIGIACYAGVGTSYTYFYGFHLGDTIKFVDRSNPAGGCRWAGGNTDGTVTPNNTTSPGPWLFTPEEGAGSYIYFDDLNGAADWTAQFEVLPQSTPSGPGGAAASSPVTYTVNLDPEDGGTCTVAKVSGPAGSWQRLPQEDACSKPGFRFVGWEARHTDGEPTTMHEAYSFINLTGDNTLYATWVPVDVPVVEPTKSTRWVVWRWDAETKRMRPVSADLVDLNPVVTIHSPKTSAVSNAMVNAAKSLAAANGGVYHGIVTSTKWSKPRIVTAYQR